MPEPSVLDWLANQPRASLFTTTVSRGEVLYGIRLLSDGKRRRGLWDAAKKIYSDDFADQVLSFDSDAADMYAEIAASRRVTGKPGSQFDAMIVAMTRSRGATVATHNVKDFEDCGVDIVNPWTA
ncbi:MAG: type II toxin-antitoxin system VapC family toxin [Steroidobacterales bacterium]